MNQFNYKTLLDELEERKENILKQLKEINIAIKALQGNNNNDRQNTIDSDNKIIKRIPWTSKIKKLFMILFLLLLLKIKMLEKGHEVNQSGIKSIFATLSRMVKDRLLEKSTIDGLYKTGDLSEQFIVIAL